MPDNVISSLDRSLPTLEVLVESSLVSLLRWNFKHNMEKTMSSSNNGQIILVGFLIYKMQTYSFSSGLCITGTYLVYSHMHLLSFLSIFYGTCILACKQSPIYGM